MYIWGIKLYLFVSFLYVLDAFAITTLSVRNFHPFFLLHQGICLEQSVSVKKVFGNKVLNFGTKSCGKSPWNKNSLEIKSYQFETLFSTNFILLPVWFYAKTSPENKSYFSRKCMGTKDVYNNAKKGQLILKTPLAILKNADV